MATVDLSLFTQRQRYVLDRTNHWLSFYKERLSVSPVLRVDFSNRMTHTAGSAERVNGIHYITYSNKFINEQSFDQVIAHELSHAFATEFYKQNCGHDARWASIMRASNYPAARCHNYKTPPRKTRQSTIVYTCKCKQQYKIGVVIQDKILEGYSYSCKECGKKITF